MRTSFHHHLMRSTLIFSYPQAGRPITPSFGAKRTSLERRDRADLALWRMTILSGNFSRCPNVGSSYVIDFGLVQRYDALFAS